MKRPLQKVIMPVMFICVLSTACEDGMKMPWDNEEENSSQESGDTLDTNTSELPDTNTTMAVDSSVTEQPNAEAENDEETEGTAGSNQAEKQWRLVISSMPSRELAEKFKARANEPEAEIRYIDRLDTYRVVYASFTSLEDAQLEFQELSVKYPDAWLVLF